VKKLRTRTLSPPPAWMLRIQTLMQIQMRGRKCGSVSLLFTVIAIKNTHTLHVYEQYFFSFSLNVMTLDQSHQATLYENQRYHKSNLSWAPVKSKDPVPVFGSGPMGSYSVPWKWSADPRFVSNEPDSLLLSLSLNPEACTLTMKSETEHLT